jgi:hypothetical protein
MNKLLTQQLDELLANSSATDLKCESALRIGAATLCHAAPTEITAARVMCDLADSDVSAFEVLVQKIADEYGLDACIEQQPSSYAVRFTWPPVPALEPIPEEKSLLARLLGR